MTPSSGLTYHYGLVDGSAVKPSRPRTPPGDIAEKTMRNDDMSKVRIVIIDGLARTTLPGGGLVAMSGFEPKPKEPKSFVLPLHHTAKRIN